MNTAKILIGLGLGVAVALLVTTDKGKDIREDISDTAKKLKKKLDKLSYGAGKDIADLQKMLGKDIEGLTDDAREKILSIIDKGIDGAQAARKNLGKQIA